MHEYGDMDPELYPGHIFERLGSRDVIGCVTVGPGMCGFLYVVSILSKIF